MPRDLGDVLHYFIPEADPEQASGTPLVSIPVTQGDVVREALVWNLAVELARLGARPTLVAPDAGPSAAPGSEGPLGVERLRVPCDELAGLARGSQDAAHDAPHDGVVLVAVPPAWLEKGADAGALLDWLLLLARPEEREVLACYGLLKRVAAQVPDARLGVSVFGVRRVAEARGVFDRLADTAERHLGRGLVSYGLLVDDVELSRSIVSGRPIGLARPASLAARALADVAGMILEDARGAARG